jgi:exodeoxyribonuclease X
MLAISKEPQMIREIRFGKYAGHTLEEILRLDRGYLEWLEQTVNDKPDLQWNVRRVLSVN